MRGCPRAISTDAGSGTANPQHAEDACVSSGAAGYSHPPAPTHPRPRGLRVMIGAVAPSTPKKEFKFSSPDQLEITGKGGGGGQSLSAAG